MSLLIRDRVFRDAFSSRVSRLVQAMRISIFSIANSLPKLGSCGADRPCSDFVHTTKRTNTVKLEACVGMKTRRHGRFVPAVFLLDKTETTDKVRLNCANF